MLLFFLCFTFRINKIHFGIFILHFQKYIILLHCYISADWFGSTICVEVHIWTHFSVLHHFSFDNSKNVWRPIGLNACNDDSLGQSRFEVLSSNFVLTDPVNLLFISALLGISSRPFVNFLPNPLSPYIVKDVL